MPEKTNDYYSHFEYDTFFLFIVLFRCIGSCARATCATLATRIQLYTHAHASFIRLMEKGFSFYAKLLVKELFT